MNEDHARFKGDMDPELRAYLEEQRTSLRELTTAVQELRSDFHEQKEQFQQQKEQFQQQKEQFQEQKNQLQELRVYLYERFEQVDSRFDKVEESDRHTRILVEDLRDDFRSLAEGFVGFQESWQADRVEIKREIGDVKSLLITSYSDLDRRVTELESRRKRRGRIPSP